MGTPLKTGGVVSTTVTVNDCRAVLPCASVALQFTVVVPMANVDPDAGLQDTGTAPSTHVRRGGGECDAGAAGARRLP